MCFFKYSLLLQKSLCFSEKTCVFLKKRVFFWKNVCFCLSCRRGLSIKCYTVFIVSSVIVILIQLTSLIILMRWNIEDPTYEWWKSLPRMSNEPFSLKFLTTVQLRIKLELNQEVKLTKHYMAYLFDDLTW